MKNYQTIFNRIASKKGQIAILIDPEKCDNGPELVALIKKAEFAKIDYFLLEEVPLQKVNLKRRFIF